MPTTNRARIVQGILEVQFVNKWRSIPLNDYKNLEIISSGANAVTVSGIHKRTMRKDCIKIYTPNISAGRTKVSIEQYLKEVRKLASLNSPNIVTVYDAFDVDNDIHIVTMEYIEGITLKQWLNERRINDKELDLIKRIELLIKILDTVWFYQNEGIIHGDLHNKNILVDNLDNIHIIDFGTSHFSKKNKSQARESFFVYDLVRQVLNERFDKNYFTVNCPTNINNNKFLANDVRNKYPILITQTMRAYVYSIDLLLQLPPSNLNPSHIVNLCVKLTNGVYIDYQYAINDIWRRTSQKIPKESVAIIIYENLNEHIIPEGVEYDQKMRSTLPEDILEIYYELSMATKKNWNIKEAEKRTFSYIKIYSKDEYDSYMNAILNAKESTYYEFVGGTDYQSIDDDKMRQIMYDALNVYFGDLFFEETLWACLNERSWRRKLSKIKSKA